MSDITLEENEYLKMLLTNYVHSSDLHQAEIHGSNEDRTKVQRFRQCEHVFDTLAYFEHYEQNNNLLSSTILCTKCKATVDFTVINDEPTRCCLVIGENIQIPFTLEGTTMQVEQYQNFEYELEHV